MKNKTLLSIKKDHKYSLTLSNFDFYNLKLINFSLTIIIILSLIFNYSFGYKPISLGFTMTLVLLLIFLHKKQNNSQELIEFIISNKLATIKKDGEKNIVVDSSKIIYWIDSLDYLHIQIYPFGLIYTKRSQELDLELSALINKPLYEKTIEANHTEYTFYLKTFKRNILTNNQITISTNPYELILNNQFTWNLLKDPHMLLVGNTGVGKTLFILELIIKSKNTSTWFLDPKHADLFNVGSLLCQKQTGSTVIEIIDLLKDVNSIMKLRYEKYTDMSVKIGSNASDLNLEPVLIIFDEVAACLSEADTKQKKELLSLFKQIILKGRQVGIIIILALQRPDADVIPGNIRDQLSCRISLGNLSDDGYRMIFGNLEQKLLSVDSTEKGCGYIQFLSTNKNPLPFNTSYWDSEFNYLQEIKNI